MIVWKVIEKTANDMLALYMKANPSPGQTLITTGQGICNCSAINTRWQTLFVPADLDRRWNPHFEKLDKDVALHLVEVKAYKNGMIELHYEVRRQPF